jgi:hypothetical protein
MCGYLTCSTVPCPDVFCVLFQKPSITLLEFVHSFKFDNRLDCFVLDSNYGDLFLQKLSRFCFSPFSVQQTIPSKPEGPNEKESELELELTKHKLHPSQTRILQMIGLDFKTETVSEIIIDFCCFVGHIFLDLN